MSLIGLLLNFKNILISLLFVELSYFGLICLFFFFSVFLNIKISFLYGIILLLTAAAESAVGLGILIVFYRFEKSIKFDNLIELGL